MMGNQTGQDRPAETLPSAAPRAPHTAETLSAVLRNLFGSRTQRDLARAYDVRQQAVSRWLSGRTLPRPATLRRIVLDHPAAAQRLFLAYLESAYTHATLHQSGRAVQPPPTDRA